MELLIDNEVAGGHFAENFCKSRPEGVPLEGGGMVKTVRRSQVKSIYHLAGHSHRPSNYSSFISCTAIQSQLSPVPPTTRNPIILLSPPMEVNTDTVLH